MKETKMVEQVESDELAEGVILWEDDLFFNIQNGYSEDHALTDYAPDGPKRAYFGPCA